MNLIEKDSWSEHDILELISAKAEENIHLDFKAAAALSKRDGNQQPKAEITKDVSAFANSDGGVIIYGLTEENHVAGVPDFVDGKEFTKEWLEQIISGGIQRAIPGLRIFAIRFGGDIAQSVYVVSIPPSPEAPHMNKDKKFYRRYEFQSVVMEEYEVRNLYNRKSSCKLEYDTAQLHIWESDDEEGTAEMDIKFIISNKGPGIAEMYKVSLVMAIPKGIEVKVQREDTTVIQEKSVVLISCTKYPLLFKGEVYSPISLHLIIPHILLSSLASMKDPVLHIHYGSAHDVISTGIMGKLCELIEQYKQKHIRTY